MDPFWMHLVGMILLILSPAFMPAIVPMVSWVSDRLAPPAPRKANARVKLTPATA
ncbi:hypothetical protein [Hoyosella altamirensis]|uniref:Uncharacterized protein n=1 Tax=Hoyosella altamirensis TaxID=616997 RepID=A0A839RLY1_9ACTN|nr:hypothetical protein [Hoyosella altamirensis]MBB3037309.1 hypothetical protein [Hoyosella altamirensis]